MPNSSTSVRFVALLSGALGATASCFAKFALDPDSSLVIFARNLLESRANETVLLAVEYIVVRAFCLILMIACNALMLGSFLRGMQESGSVAGTALASAANFVVSAFYGYLIFAEDYVSSPQWWLGFAMVIAGVTLLSSSSSSTVVSVKDGSNASTGRKADKQE